MQRLILIFTLAFMPVVSYAETTNDLGPPTSDNQGPSTQTSELLQPTSSTTLQNLQGADAIEGGIPQVSGNSDLQAAGGQTEFNSYAGPTAVTSGERQALPDNQTNPWIFWPLAILGLGAMTLMLPGKLKAQDKPNGASF